MISFSLYIKNKYLNKQVLVDCFNGKQIKGELTKVYATFMVVEVAPGKPVTMRVNQISFIQEVENGKR